MAQTMAQRILASHCGREELKAGEFIVASVDAASLADRSARDVPEVLEQLGVSKPALPVMATFDHMAPAPNAEYAGIHKSGRWHCQRMGIPYNDVGTGIHLQLPIEAGMVRPGMLFVGGDSHTVMLGALGALATGVGVTEMVALLATGQLWFRVPPSIRVEVSGELPDLCMGKDAALWLLGKLGSIGADYRAMEFGGPGVRSLSMDARLSVANMVVEMGAKAGIFEADEVTLEFLRCVTDEPVSPFGPDPGAVYESTCPLRLSDLEPMVACPPRIDNVIAVRSILGKEVHQAFLGSCTNGRLEDLRVAARIVKGRKVHRNVRFLVCPASQRVFQQAIEEGLIEVLSRAGAVFLPPSCGPDCGEHLGMLADGEVEIGSSNRNTPGRRGSFAAEILVASPATVAASALNGQVADPRESL